MRKSCLFPIVLCSSLLCLSFSYWHAETTSTNPQGHAPYRYEDPGMDTVLVIDVSGSMKQSDPDCLCRGAARDFIEHLQETPGSRAALVTFSDTLQDVIPLTDLDSPDAESGLLSKLDTLSYTSGDTDIGSAMERAVRLLTKGRNRNRTGSIFLLTDGEIDLPAAPDEEAAEKESLTRALMAVEQAKAEGIVIHSVALDLGGSIDRNLINYMADSTGGTSNVVNSASSLEKIFQNLSEYAARQAVPETEAELLPAETEAETEEETEEETETETESETEEIPRAFVTTIGSVDGPIHLKGLFPGLCGAQLNLSDLFRLEGGVSGFTDSIRYTAYPDDNTLLSCAIEGDTLTLSGVSNGTGRVKIIAEPSAIDALQGSWDDTLPGYGGILYDGIHEDGVLTRTDTGTAELSFLVEIDALIPSFWYLALIPALVALTGILVFLLRNQGSGKAKLSGSLQWYVRGENEKIFGMPPRTMAELGDYGSKVRLSDLIRDDLLRGAPLHKVIITGTGQGILIHSLSGSILIAAAGGRPQSRIELTRSGQFRVFCETGEGRCAIIASYTSEAGYRTESSHQDDSEERTRLLV